MTKPLMLHQEVLLLALHDGPGTFSSGMYIYAVGGAMLSELMLIERIVVHQGKEQTVAVVDGSPTGCELLDEVLQAIDTSTKPRGLQHWVTKAAGIKELNHRLAQNLCELGVLKEDEKKVLFVFSRRIYPELDCTWEDAIRRRMSDVMFHPEVEADVRTSALISLAFYAELLTSNFASEQIKQHKTRIKELADGKHLASDATKAAIEAIQAAIMVAVIIPVVISTTTSG